MELTFVSLSKSNYDELTAEILVNAEKQSKGIYLDSRYIPTIGIGFNVQDNAAVRDAVLARLGFDVNAEFLTGVALTKEQGYIQQIIGLVTQRYSSKSQESGLKTNLINIMKRRATDSDYPADFSRRSNFSFNDTTEMVSILPVVLPGYEQKVDNFLAGIPDSRERAALLSLSFNSKVRIEGGLEIPTTLGPGLRNAMVNGDRAEAWFQIRYNTNPVGTSDRGGIAKRRFYEAEVFGLYDNPTATSSSVSEDGARNVYEMFSRHRTAILSYEGLFGTDASRSRIAEANRDYHLAGTAYLVRTLDAALLPAGGYLIGKYVVPTGYVNPDEVSMRDIWVTGDHPLSVRTLSGSNRSDLMIAGQGVDVLSGLGGNDVLHGGGDNDTLLGGIGSDILVGGSGSDIYRFAAGDGTDTIIDYQGDGFEGDGNGELLYGDQRIADASVKLSDTQWKSADGKFTYTNQSGDLVITLLDQSDTITIKHFDFDHGALGITLSKGAKVAISEGATDPYTGNPDYVAPGDQSTGLKEGYAKSFNASVSEASAVERWIKLTITGATQFLKWVLDGVVSDASANDEIIVPLPAGHDSVDFALLANADFDVDQSVQVTATLLNPDRSLPDDPATSSIAINLDAVDETTPTFPAYTDPPVETTTLFNPNSHPLIGPGGVNASLGSPYLITVGSAEAVEIHAGGVIDAGPGDNYIFSENTISDWIHGQEGRDAIYTTGGDDHLYGGVGDDAIQAGEGDDYLQGDEGNDLLAGGAGSDVLIGGNDNDVLLGGGGLIPDTWDWSVSWSFDADTIGFQRFFGPFVVAGDTDDFLDGGEGDDYLWGGDGADQLFGGAGRDKLTGGAGDDTLEGGDGSDALWGDGTQDPLRPDIPYTYPEYHGADYLDGGAGDDQLVGDGGDDLLIGGTGNDTLYGDDANLAGQWHGNDYLDGGDGADTVFGQGKDDVLFGGAGNDIVYGDGESVDFAFHGADTLYGEDGDDSLSGDGGADRLYGGAGNDQLFGDSDAVPEQYQGDDYLDGEDGDDYLRGYGGNDELSGGGGDDELHGEKGDDTLDGGEGKDLLFGGDGEDLLFGGSDDDELSGEAGADYLDGGEGDDLVSGGDGDDVLFGGSGNDQLTGEEGNDELDGQEGDDNLFGQGGDDTLTGGDGADHLEGGAGNDTYFIDASDTLLDNEGQNTLSFVDSTTLDDIQVLLSSDSGEHLAFLVQDHEFLDQQPGDLTFTSFGFADGTSISVEELLGRLYTNPKNTSGDSEDDTISGYAGGDSLRGEGGNDLLFGYRGDDFLDGGSGDDELQGGEGSDQLTGGVGSDAYDFDRGDGQDTITENGSAEDYDAILMGPDVAPEDVSLTRFANGDLKLAITGTNDSVTIKGQYADATSAVEEIVFDDGTVVGTSELNALGVAPIEGTNGDDTLVGTQFDETILGYAGNDTLDGGLGSDTLEGGDGLDTYVLALGGGRDTVTDASPEGSRIQPGSGIAIADLAATREGNDLFVSVRGTGDGLLLKDYYTTPRSWSVVDAGGGSATAEDVLAQTQQAAADEQAYAEQLLGDFVRARRAQIVAGYRAQGYAQIGPDELYKPWTQSPGADVSAFVSRATSTSTITFTPSGGGGSSSTFDTFVSEIWSGHIPTVIQYDAQIQTTTIDSDDAYISVPYSYAIHSQVARQATLAVSWGTPSGSTTSSFVAGPSYPAFVAPYIYSPITGELIGTYIGTYGTSSSYNTFSGGAAGRVTGVLELGPELSNQYPYWTYSTSGSGGAIVQLPSPPSLRGWFISENTSESISVVVGGDSDNNIGWDNVPDIALGGGGDDQVAASHFAYGGEGDDWVFAPEIAMGGPGDDHVYGKGLVVGGEGSDNLSGGDAATTFEIDPSELGNDRVFDSGESTARYDRWYYSSLGISQSDEQLRRAHPGTFEVHVHNIPTGDDVSPDFISYVSTLDQVAQLWPYATYEVNRYLDPLPALPLIAANDYAALQPLYAAGVIDQDVVKFDAGVGLDDLALSWEKVDAYSGNPYTALKLSWGEGKSLDVLVPHTDDPIGTGTEKFLFAGGTSISIRDLIALAGPHPSFDPQLEDQVLTGTPNDDVIFGALGNDTVDGLGGNDVLSGGAGNDLLLGGQGDDNLSGDAGDDTLDGAAGSDVLIGGSGHDTYVFGRGYGQDTISFNYAPDAAQAEDRALFNPDVSSQDVQVTRDYDNIYLAIRGMGDRLTITSWFDGTFFGQDLRIGSVQFADGTSWDADQVEAHLVPADPTEGDDFIYGTSGDDTLNGLGGNDTLVGDSGEDALVGGTGNDYLAGGADDDTYVFNLGDGVDHIDDSEGANTLAFGQGIGAADLTLGLGSLMIEVGSGGDVVHIDQFDPSDPLGGVSISTFRFADGTSLSYAQLIAKGFDISGTDDNDYLSGTAVTDRIRGGANDDTLDGGAGDDTLNGGAGNDIYIFGQGYGHDVVQDQDVTPGNFDSVQFNFDVAPADVTVLRQGDDLVLSINGTQDTLTLESWFAGSEFQIEQVAFADGTTWDVPQLQAMAGPASNVAPVVTVPDQTLGLGATVAAASLFSVSDANGDVPTQFEFWDSTDRAGSAAFVLDGVTQAANQSIPVSAAQLASLQVQGGSLTGIDQLWVRAYDGELWSDWKSFSLVSGTPQAPVVSVSDQTLDLDQTVAVSTLFTAADPSGDAITQYQFWDSTDRVGSAHFSVGGVAQPANQSITVSADDLANASLVSGSATGVDQLWVRAYDGQLWGEWKSFNLTSGLPQAPTVSVSDQSLDLGQSVLASTVFSASDPNGDAIAQYQFWDSTDRAGSAYFSIDGVQQAANQAITVDASQLADTRLIAGSATGTDQLWVRGSDGQLWSDWKSFNLTTGNPQPPSATVSDQALALNAVVAASSLFTVSDPNGDAITQYEFWDSTDSLGSGYLAVDGIAQGANQSILVASDQLASTTLVGGSATGVDQLWVRAFDGQLWSDWKSFNVTSGVPHAPTVAVSDQNLALNQSVLASSVFSVSDPDGDAMTQYQFWDSTDRADSATFTIDGQPQAANQNITVTADQLSHVRLVAGSLSGTDQLWVRASDGQLWSDWKSFNVTSGTPLPPSATVSDQTLSLDVAVPVSTLFTVSDPNGDAIAQYQFWDSTDRAGSAAFYVGGQAQGANQAITVDVGELTDTELHSGAVTGTDQLWVRASDGQLWSDWKSFNLTSGNPQAPVVTGTDQTIPLNAAVEVADLFSVSDVNGDAIAQYQLWDSNADAGSAYFALDGVQQPANQSIDVTAAELANAQAQAGSGAATDQLWIRASDGQLWSDWKSLNLATSDGQLLEGSSSADTQNGGAASDILQGLGGDDQLLGAAGNDLLDGGAGADHLIGSSGNDLLLGGAGDDALDPGAGSNVIGFNAGDGHDTLDAEAGANDALSLGGGIRYQDLSLSKSGDDLVLDTGNGDAIDLKSWYAAGASHSVSQLQVIADVMPGYDPASSDPLLNKKVQQFDFAQIVEAYDQARAADATLTQWSVMNALLDAHLAGSDTEALGGDLAYQYGHAGTLSGVGFGPAEQVLKSSQLGSQQALQPETILKEGLVKLA